MKKYFMFIIPVFLFTSCASYHQLMVGPNGDIQDCSGTGSGLIGMAVAQSHTNSCAETLMKAGYRKIEFAGVIGITLSSDDSLRIIKIAPNSPAQKAHLSIGEKIISIDGVNVKNSKDAGILLFGDIWSSVKLVTQFGKIKNSYDIPRGAYSDIYSTK